MEKVLNWLAEHVVELIALLVTTSFGGIAAFSLVTYVHEFWERNPLLTALYTCLCVVAGIGVGIVINLSKYLTFKKELEEKERKRAEEKEKEIRDNIHYARKAVMNLSFDEKSTLKNIFENGSKTGTFSEESVDVLFGRIREIFDVTEIGANKWLVSLTSWGKFCAEHSKDILDKLDEYPEYF